MGIVVQKYGGSSVANSERIKNVARRVVETMNEGHQVVTVVSALGDTTDELIELASQITDYPPEREMDMLLSTGEQVSISLLAMAIDQMGYPVISLTGAQVGIITTGTHSKAKILNVNDKRIKEELDRGKIVIVAGFQGVNEHNDITTLGRGGSDTTAVAVAAALKADVCEIYTDVDGVYTADPRMIPDARKLPEVSYDEMLEMASLGAKVLHSRSVEYAKKHDVVMHVRSSFNHHEGTIVKGEAKMEKMIVSGVTCDTHTAKITIKGVPDEPGIAYHVFNDLAKAEVNVDMIVQSAGRNGINDISFTVEEDDFRKGLEMVREIAAKLKAEDIGYNKGVAKVSIVGAGMASNAGVAAKMFEALMEAGINIDMISTSEIKVSCIVEEIDVQRAVEVIHKKFNLGE